MNQKRQKIKAQQLAIRSGDIVEVKRDDGTKESHQAVSDPWQLGGDWVVMLDGISGGYDLARCRKITVVAR